MIKEALRIIYTAFVSEDRQKLRRAMRLWCADGGCIMYRRY